MNSMDPAAKAGEVKDDDKHAATIANAFSGYTQPVFSKLRNARVRLIDLHQQLFGCSVRRGRRTREHGGAVNFSDSSPAASCTFRNAPGDGGGTYPSRLHADRSATATMSHTLE
ncbi:hypothetical protein [Rhodopila globiformis]|uniref:hypothetical protein n=1 Tax=Rhodopila globiformis TaxID=1071 RepID=UPI0011B05619|nr:hypothetical protein [Rhodopila globiformis]